MASVMAVERQRPPGGSLRAEHLAFVLRGTADLRVVACMCCEHHAADAEVARSAAALAGVDLVDVDISAGDPTAIRKELVATGASLLLACAEGTEAWRASGHMMMVLGDGPGIRWWRSAELRAAALMAKGARPKRTAPEAKAAEVIPRWARRRLSSGLAAVAPDGQLPDARSLAAHCGVPEQLARRFLRFHAPNGAVGESPECPVAPDRS